MKQRAKVVLALLLVATGAALALVGAAPAAYASVSDVTTDPAAFEGRSVEMKATVMPGSVNMSTPLTFTVRDDRAALPVVWDAAKPVPDHEGAGSLEGRTIVVSGTVTEQDGRWVLLAHDMQVGCASKYEPA